MRDYRRKGRTSEPADAGFAFSAAGTGYEREVDFRSLRAGRKNATACFARTLTTSLTFASGTFSEIDFNYDPNMRTAWCFMKPVGPPRFTLSMMDELNRLHLELAKAADPILNVDGAQPQFYVGGSRVPGIFNLGGDLEYFMKCIKQGVSEPLRDYARQCIRISHDMDYGLGERVITICVIQGDALGGGLEGALSFNVLIAERNTKLGLPESLFNGFPGMGAYSILSRKVGSTRARDMILSGELFSAERLYELGLITVLAEPGRGIEAARDFIKENQRRHNLLLSIEKVRRRVNPISFQELTDITDIWVDTAMNLTKADLRRMELLLAAQIRKKNPARA